jgi:hypothetical protein
MIVRCSLRSRRAARKEEAPNQLTILHGVAMKSRQNHGPAIAAAKAGSAPPPPTGLKAILGCRRRRRSRADAAVPTRLPGCGTTRSCRCWKPRPASALHKDVVCGQHGWWDLCEEIGAPGYDPYGPDGANLNLLIDRRAVDPISGTAPHRSFMCQVEPA